MTEILEINLFNSIAIFVSSVIPIYLSFRVKGYLRKLTILLSIFAISHAIYHTSEVIGFQNIAEEIIEPLSLVILIIFGLTYWKTRMKRKVPV